MRLAAHRIGLPIYLRASSEIDNTAGRLTKLWWPNVIDWGDVTLVTESMVEDVSRNVGGHVTHPWVAM